MKKTNIIKIAILTILIIPYFAFAKADININSSKLNVSKGNQFTVNIVMSPIDETAYTSKVSLSYPGDLLEVVSYKQADSWLSINQPGYDAIDGIAGKIVKTAGYPNGIAKGSNMIFGTITFRAKTVGNASIKVNGESEVYNDQNKNIFSGNPSLLAINISSAIVTPIVKSNTSTSSTTDITVVDASTTGTSTNQQASVQGLLNYNIGYIIGLIIIAIAGYIGYRIYKR